MPKPLAIFFSYSHRDEELRDELEKHLSQLRRNGLIENWHDRRIGAGEDWADAIDEHVRSADIILLLISPDFLASDYCYGVELQIALERHKRHDAVVIPVIVRPVDWSGALFAHLQALPKDARPVTSWSNRDEALADVARGIRAVIARLQSRAPRDSGAESKPAGDAGPKPRVVDAAIPSHVVQGRPAELQVLIRLPGSPGLKGILLDDEESEATPEDVRSKDFSVSFPLGPDSQPEPLKVQVKVTSPDFQPPEQVKSVFVPVDADSEVCTFLLTPVRTGRLKVLVELQWEDAVRGSRRLRTECFAESAEPPGAARMNLVRMPVAILESDAADFREGGPPTLLRPPAPAPGPPPVAAPAPVSASSSAIMSAVSGLAGIGLLLFYVAKVPTLVSAGADSRVFYALLIPWGLCAAAFLFGALRSYASYSGSTVGNHLVLGGPVVLFALVVAGGFQLVPSAPLHDLTVRVASKTEPLIATGSVILEIGNNRLVEPIGGKGEATFKSASTAGVGSIRVLPRVPGYAQEWQAVKIPPYEISVELKKPPVKLAGHLIPPPQPTDVVEILFDGRDLGRAHADGTFEFTLAGDAQASGIIQVLVNGKRRYNDVEEISDHLELKLTAN